VAGMLALVALAFGHGSTPASHFDLSPSVVFGGASLTVLFTALVPILFAYGGWQSCASIAGEIKDPARNLARANVLGVMVVVTLYLSLNLAYLWVLTPAEVAASPAVAADAARAVAGPAGARFVALLIVISSFGFLAVVILTGARLYYAMAADGLFLGRAARLHARYRTPVFALWFQAAISLALLMTNTYDQLLSYVVFADWLFFGLTAGALVIIRRREPLPAAEVARTPGHPATTGLFIAIAAGVVLNSLIAYPAQSLIGSAILGIGAIVFFVMAKGHNHYLS
jgi:basic amino acid/polyamine antiporter, APA family